jgi:3-hydroxyacyl-CoA dehydrogenase
MANNINQPAPLRLADIKAAQKPLATNASASLWNIGDGVACLEFHSKLNTIDSDTISMGLEAVAIASKTMRALVIYNEAPHFSAGANLGLVIGWAQANAWKEIDNFLKRGQDMMSAIKFASIPVVAAPTGLVLGGGCEILLHCTAVQAHNKLNVGLVETLVGVIPGFGGCKEMLVRNQNAPHFVERMFEQIALAKTATSTEHAKALNYLRPNDGITLTHEDLLSDAKTRALELAVNHQPPKAAQISLPGSLSHAILATNFERLKPEALPHDKVISKHLAEVLSGGKSQSEASLSETDILALEREHFIALCKIPETIARMETMLKTGKPLRN